MRSNASAGRRGQGFVEVIGETVKWGLLAAIAGGTFLLVSLYASGLRDPRYLDGWILAGGMALQVAFHIAIKLSALAPKSAARWRKVHILLGYLLIAPFVSHSDFSLPDTVLEWALWLTFVFVTASGLFGMYLEWSLRHRREIEDSANYDRFPALRRELSLKVQAVVADETAANAPIALPGLPHDSWIRDLYTTRLRSFFDGPRNFSAHLVGSQQPIRNLISEIDDLSRYVDQQGQEKLSAIKDLAIEKDRLDFAQVQLGLARAWLFVHVPVTYSLIVLTIVHVIVVYAYSSGAW